MRSAHIVSTLANINRDPKKRPKPFELKEFLLFERPEKKKAPTMEQAGGGAKIDPSLMAWLFWKANQDKKDGDATIEPPELP